MANSGSNNWCYSSHYFKLLIVHTPGWRNGIRRGLKIPGSHGHEGSTPSPGTSNVRYDLVIMFTLSVCHSNGAPKAVIMMKS